MIGLLVAPSVSAFTHALMVNSDVIGVNPRTIRDSSVPVEGVGSVEAYFLTMTQSQYASYVSPVLVLAYFSPKTIGSVLTTLEIPAKLQSDASVV